MGRGVRLPFGLRVGVSTDEPLPMPPPYRRMVAINSDVEWTTWEAQLDILEAFAERGLELSASFWMFAAPAGTWCLFRDKARMQVIHPAVRAMASRGLLDTLHSIGGRLHNGGCDFSRAEIQAGYACMAQAGIFPLIYSNHGGRADTQNVAGTWATYQEGDLPGSDVYHLDLTRAHGMRFFWCDPDYTTDLVSLSPSCDDKDSLFVAGEGRDGQAFVRFRRFLGRLNTGPSLDNFAAQMDQVLGASQPGYTVMYQHLGVERKEGGTPTFARSRPLRADALMALDRLAESQARGEILVTSTSRLLNHAALMAAKPWRIQRVGRHRVDVEFEDVMRIGGVSLPLSWETLQGWTLPGSGSITEATVTLRGERRPLSAVYEKDDRRWFGIPWVRLDMHSAIAEIRRLADSDDHG